MKSVSIFFDQHFYFSAGDTQPESAVGCCPHRRTLSDCKLGLTQALTDSNWPPFSPGNSHMLFHDAHDFRTTTWLILLFTLIRPVQGNLWLTIRSRVNVQQVNLSPRKNCHNSDGISIKIDIIISHRKHIYIYMTLYVDIFLWHIYIYIYIVYIFRTSVLIFVTMFITTFRWLYALAFFRWFECRTWPFISLTEVVCSSSTSHV